MTNKIVYFPSPFPSPSATKSVAPINTYKSTSRTEILISIWFCAWAMLTAAECIRQMSSLAI
jgi:hypothetical protein